MEPICSKSDACADLLTHKRPHDDFQHSRESFVFALQLVETADTTLHSTPKHGTMIPTAKMAVSSEESRSFTCSIQRAAGRISDIGYTFHVSDDTLNKLVGFCAGSGALIQLERMQTRKLIKRLSASQPQDSDLGDDDETWAARVGGNVVGERRVHSNLTPWEEPKDEVIYRFREQSQETAHSMNCSTSHDGSLYGSLLKNSPSPNSSAVPHAGHLSSILRARISPQNPNTPPSTAQEIGAFPPVNRYAQSTSSITPPTSSFPAFVDVCYGVQAAMTIETPSTVANQTMLRRRAMPTKSNATSLLQRAVHYQVGRSGGLRQPNREKRTKEQEGTGEFKQANYEKHTKEPRVGDESDDFMDDDEVAQWRDLQARRPDRNSLELYPPAEVVTLVPERKQQAATRPVKIGGAARGRAAVFRDRELTRRRAPITSRAKPKAL